MIDDTQTPTSDPTPAADEGPIQRVVREIREAWNQKWNPDGSLTDEQVNEIGHDWIAGGKRLHS